MGRGIHMVKARVRAKMGARINIEIEDVAGRRGSFIYICKIFVSEIFYPGGKNISVTSHCV